MGLLVRWLNRLRLGARPEWQNPLAVIRSSGLVDAEWYKQQYPDVQGSGLDLARHWLQTGCQEASRPNPYFDPDWYLETYPDVRASGHNPLVHYILWGAAEGRHAGPNFDTKAYIAANPDVKAAGMNPLRHYLHHGRHEGRFMVERNYARPTPPEWSAFVALANESRSRNAASLPNGSRDVIDVIVPVYRALDDTLACLYSVLSSNPTTAFELVVVDDQSPEPELSAALVQLADLGLITLLVNERNLGFVGTVNRGMKLHPARDVVLLNSDTEVYGDWLDRLVSHAIDTTVATVTPFSNNATICSYPDVSRDNPSLLEIGYSELDGMAACNNRGQSIELPTGIGFCMLVSRRALNCVGYFDAERFGKGYGEENDFCMRAARQGMQNRMALDVFVRHTGKLSFAGDSNEASARAQDIINGLYPEYAGLVQLHYRRDPAFAARRRLDIARLARHIGGKPSTLCFTHTLGGGVHRYLTDRAQEASDIGRGLIVASSRWCADENYNLSINSVSAIELPNLMGPLSDLLGDDGEKICRALDVDVIEVHSLVGSPAGILEQIPRLADRLGLQYRVMLHDYAPICPQINLIDETGLYCGEKGVEQCRVCLAKKQAPAHMVHGTTPIFGQNGPAQSAGIDISEWRAAYHQFLRKAASVSVPSRDTAERYRRYFADIEMSVIPHREESPQTPVHSIASPYIHPDRLRIAVIGAIGPPKGSNVLEALAEDAAGRQLPIDFIVVGFTNRDKRLGLLQNVMITGAYKDSEVFALIEKQRCHIALLPSVCPETYSYTFSIACAAGLPTVVFDLGAQAERGRAHDSVILPLTLASQPAELNNRLFAIGAERAVTIGSGGTRNFRVVGGVPGSARNSAISTNRFSNIVSSLELDRAVYEARRNAHELSRVDYVMLFTPRSGSTWLTSLLSGSLGFPDEYLNPEFVRNSSIAMQTKDPSEFLDMLRRLRKSRNGVFGVQVRSIDIELFDAAAFHQTFQEARYFNVWRRNIVAQAVSLYKAVSTSSFHSFSERTGPPPPVEIDDNAILRWLRHIAIIERANYNILRAMGYDYVDLVYEDITGNSERALGMISRHIGVEADLTSINRDKETKKIGNDWNIEVEHRFRTSQSAAIEMFYAARPLPAMSAHV